MDDRDNVLLGARAGGQPLTYSRLALASFVCAVLSMTGLILAQLEQALVALTLFFIPAIVMGHLARSRFRAKPGAFRNESMATFGLAVGYLVFFLNVFVVATMLFLVTP